MIEDSPAAKPWWKRAIGKMILGTVALALLAGLVGLEENWRGTQSWEDYKGAWRAEGERFDLKDFTLAPVPDEENFFKTPFLQAEAYGHRILVSGSQPLSAAVEWGEAFKGDWKVMDLGAIQRGLKANTNFDLDATQSPAQAVLEAASEIPEVYELWQAAQRKYSQCNPMLNLLDDKQTLNFVTLRNLLQLFAVCATAELAVGKTDEARADARVIERLITGMRGNGTLVSAMIRVAGSECLVQVFWEGWKERKWSEAQLRQFEDYFASLNMVFELDRALHMEPVVMEDAFQRAGGKGGSPASATLSGPLFWALGKGWLSRNFLVYDELTRRDCYPSCNPTNGVVFPRICHEGEVDAEQFVDSRSPFRVIASIGMVHFEKAFITTAQRQAYVNEAAIVCALERFQMEKGHYPEKLDELAPRYVASIPKDPIDGKAFHYRADGAKFLLYSVGWDEKDDGGKPGARDEDGDWVWRYSEEHQTSTKP